MGEGASAVTTTTRKPRPLLVYTLDTSQANHLIRIWAAAKQGGAA